MLIPVEFASVNEVSDMPAGNYAARCLVYSQQGGSAQALVFEYTRLDSGKVHGCDLVIVDADAVVRAADFVLLPDLTWRGSFGEKGAILGALLPHEIESWALIEERDLATVQIGTGND